MEVLCPKLVKTYKNEWRVLCKVMKRSFASNLLHLMLDISIEKF